MNSIAKRCTALCCLILLGWVSSLSAHPKLQDQRDIGAPEFRAARALEIAYREFSRVVIVESKGGGDRGLLDFLSHMENYKISIIERGDSFKIRFSPLEYPGGSLRGGGAEYSVGKISLAIEKIELFE